MADTKYKVLDVDKLHQMIEETLETVNERITERIIKEPVSDADYSNINKILSAKVILDIIGKSTDSSDDSSSVYALINKNNSAISKVDSETKSSLSTIESGLQTAESDITDLKNRMGTTESSINTINDSIGKSTDEGNDKGSIHARITAVKTTADAAVSKGELNSITTRLTSAETEINSLNISVGTNADEANETGSVYARIKKNSDDILSTKAKADAAVTDEKLQTELAKPRALPYEIITEEPTSIESPVLGTIYLKADSTEDGTYNLYFAIKDDTEEGKTKLVRIK